VSRRSADVAEVALVLEDNLPSAQNAALTGHTTRGCALENQEERAEGEDHDEDGPSKSQTERPVGRPVDERGHEHQGHRDDDGPEDKRAGARCHRVGEYTWPTVGKLAPGVASLTTPLSAAASPCSTAAGSRVDWLGSSPGSVRRTRAITTPSTITTPATVRRPLRGGVAGVREVEAGMRRRMGALRFFVGRSSAVLLRPPARCSTETSETSRRCSQGTPGITSTDGGGRLAATSRSLRWDVRARRRGAVGGSLSGHAPRPALRP
jgi:hypothetical protein